MKDRQRSKLLHSLVKSARLTKEYPGYEYEYFRSFEELDAYLRSICGEDWESQEWVNVWLNKSSAKKENKNE